MLLSVINYVQYVFDYRVGVNVLWKILMDMDIEPDDELEEKVLFYTHSPVMIQI